MFFFCSIFKSHPELAKSLEICPFNATHFYLGSDKEQHLFECPDNTFTQNKVNLKKEEQQARFKPPVPNYTLTRDTRQDGEEDWGIFLVHDTNFLF